MRLATILAAALFVLLPMSTSATVRYVDVHNASSSPPFTNWATAARTIQQAVDAAVNGDQILVSNGTYRIGGRVVFGAMTNRVAVNKPVTVQSVNGAEVTVIQGFQMPGTTNGDRAVRCVYLSSGAALVGFTLTDGATRSLGDVDREQNGGGVWCASASVVVSNCVVTRNSAQGNGGGVSGGTLSNCTLTDNSAGQAGGGAYGGSLNNCTLTGNYSAFRGGGAMESTLNDCTLNGNSAVHGGGAHSCTLSNCTLTDNSAELDGGGAFHCTLNNCTLTANSASHFGGGVTDSTLTNCTLTGNSAGDGGGAHTSTLNRCTLTGNSAGWDGGGAYRCTLNNCTVSENFANRFGGGAYSGRLNNCTVIGNSAADYGGVYGGSLNNCVVYYNEPDGTDYSETTSLNYCCTPLIPPGGQGNFADEPLFVNQVAGDLRLQPDSPCIDAGGNDYAPAGPDLDGNPRIVSGTVDVGAYEFQSLQTIPFHIWLQQYGLAGDGSADHSDTDNDGLDNWQEWRVGTNPTNSLSVLRLRSPTAGPTGVIVRWQSVSGLTYFLERSTDLAAAFQSVATNIVGQAGTTVYTDTTALGAVAVFYRVGVKN